MSGQDSTRTIAGQPSAKRSQLVRWPASRRRGWLFATGYLVFLMGVAWGGMQLYWMLTVRGGLRQGVDKVWDQFYPELRQSGVLTATISQGDRTFDVLMLGASTIEKGWGNIEQLLQAGLETQLQRPVRVFNLARIAHTSRDSMLKYSRVASRPFDLIVVYDGFNDCRMNNCPREMFREDYTQCSWYRSFQRRLTAQALAQPRELLADLSDSIGLGTPDPNFLQYGSDLKTPAPFRRNLTEIITRAAKTQTLVVLQTFAYHIPPGYSDDKFRRGELDYGDRAGSNRCPLEMWGQPDDVTRCVDEHNRIIRDLARHYPSQTVLVDQFTQLPGGREYFIDACHLTDAGCQKFVDNLLIKLPSRISPDAVQPLIRPPTSPATESSIESSTVRERIP